MTQDSLISVIVPVYNTEKYIGECIDSILAQSYSQFEIILVDDGSPDNAGTICDEYATKDSRIKVFHQKNEGVTSARYLGAKNATGRWLFFADSDDVVPHNSFELLMNATKETDSKIIKGSFGKFDDKFHELRLIFPRGEVGFKKYFNKQRVNGLCSGLFEKNLFLGLVQPSANLKIGEDAMLMYQGVALTNKIFFIPEECFSNRSNECGVTQSGKLGLNSNFTNLSAYISGVDTAIIGNKTINTFSKELVKNYSISLLQSFQPNNKHERIFIAKYVKKYLILDPFQWYLVSTQKVKLLGYKILKKCKIK